MWKSDPGKTQATLSVTLVLFKLSTKVFVGVLFGGVGQMILEKEDSSSDGKLEVPVAC